jgi:hypothetical protein
MRHATTLSLAGLSNRSESPYLPIRHFLTNQSRSDHSFSNGIQRLKPEKAEKLTQETLKK